MHIIYDGTPWERQFLFNELLPPFQIVQCNRGGENIDYWRLQKHNYLIGDNIFIFGAHDSNFDNILNIVTYLKPKIIIHLSDEFAYDHRYQTEIPKLTLLYIRQYHFYHYPIRHKNIIWKPLGYMNGMLEMNYQEIKLKKPAEREYAWSFVGYMKSDRPNMIKMMSEIEPNKYELMSSVEMRETYRNSIFVPNGRGEKNLNCFRLYEASLCGAIPIVVGSKSEIRETFLMEENPPWLFCQSWTEAKEKCKELLKNPNQLDLWQAYLLKWWHNRVKGIQEKILTTLNLDLDSKN